MCDHGRGAQRKNPLPRMLKKSVQQGRSERSPEAYPLGDVEALNDARTPLAGFFSIPLNKDPYE